MEEKDAFTMGDLVDLAEQPSLVETYSKAVLVRIVRALLGLAFRDSLTHLWNRTYFTIRFQRMLQESGATSDYRGCAVIMIDLNDFKAINDTAGHPAGDKFLQKTGRALQEAFRQQEEDIVARVGGDEFGILLRNISEQNVKGVLTRLTDVLRRHEVGASIGALYCPPLDNLDGKRIISRADQLMYAAKRDHRRTNSAVEARLDVYTPTLV